MTSSVNETENADRYAVTTWGVLDEEFLTPSGQLCRIKKLDFEDVMASGFMDQLNTLQGVVDKGIRKGQGQPPADPLKMMKDRRTAGQMARLMNQVVCLVVTAPKVEMPPENPQDRKVGVVYADTVHMGDKMAIFTKAMGDLEELESFRGKADESA